MYSLFAYRELETILAGYTHLQRALPVRFSHWLMSYGFMFRDDAHRLHDLLRRVNVSPLGSGAIAGSPFAIDRDLLAKDLGFDSASLNSIHAVGDRDFVVEFLFWAALAAVHMSRLAEDLVIYSSVEFGFVTIADQFR